MPDVAVSVVVTADGKITLRNWAERTQHDPGPRLDLGGLDGRVLRLFEEWMSLRTISWREEDIRVFGQLLHRRLFPGDSWAWIEDQVAACGEGDRARLWLGFPSDAAASRMASLPWEYLCTQDRPGRRGRFLGLEPGLTMSRVLPSGSVGPGAAEEKEVRILPVVGESDNPALGTVRFQEVLDEIERTGRRPGFSTLPPVGVDGSDEQGPGATEAELRAAVAEHHPHVVHYLGHGRFRDGTGAVALLGATGDTDWVSQDRLARALCDNDWSPTVVVLHACEGGAVDFDYRFAGLAPAIVEAGAQCAVAMQYAVTNATATTFSSSLYAALADNRSFEDALHVARRTLWEQSGDPRLIGVPLVYQRRSAPLFVGKD